MPIKVVTMVEYSLTFNDEMSEEIKRMSYEEFNEDIPAKRQELLKQLVGQIGGDEGITGVSVDHFSIRREEI